ncbi:MAG: uncharacterized protein QOF37_1009 [Thermoleophilaceae bacterium]|jgi:uncharacterized protein YciI|nr:uncharacterized protein [Thermoleophilaceae bacterium]
MPTPYQALLYDYVENAVEARAPHREAHLEKIKRAVEDGEIHMAGALGDPPHGGLLVFNGDDPSVAERFAAGDPYVANGVVTRWRVEPWTVVS